MAQEHFVEGWTDPIDYQLKKGDPAASFDATGMSVAIVMADLKGVSITLTGTIAWQDAAVSKVRFTPAAADLKAADSPLRVRFKVTNGAAIAYFPRRGHEEWIISAIPK